MSDPLSRYTQRKKEDEPNSSPFPLRQMLTFRWRSGNLIALPYAYLLWMTFNPSNGITLHFNTHTVMLKGFNLASVFEALLSFQLSELVEVDDPRLVNGTEKAVITQILAKENHEELSDTAA